MKNSRRLLVPLAAVACLYLLLASPQAVAGQGNAGNTNSLLQSILTKVSGGFPASLDGAGNFKVAVQSTPVTSQLPATLVNGGLQTNGATVFGSSTGESALQNWSTTPATLTTNTGGALSARQEVHVTNVGVNDAWVSPVSGGHTFYVPATSDRTIYIKTGVTLYVMTTTGTSAGYAMELGY